MKEMVTAYRSVLGNTMPGEDLRNKHGELVGVHDYWIDGRWIKYWEERMKVL